MDAKTKKNLLELARNAIMNAHNEKELKKLLESKSIEMKGGVFISVYVGDDLRGCIGNLNTVDIHRGVIKNAVMAAYYDDRFPQIEKGEFSKMKVHINILSAPRGLEFTDYNDLLAKIDSKHGVIIEKGASKATFLPSVWKELPGKIDFLEHLCLKAGLAQDEWRMPGLKVYIYESDEFSE